MPSFDDIIQALQHLLEEQGTPRNVREKVQGMIQAIKAEGDSRMKADRLLAQTAETRNVRVTGIDERLARDLRLPSTARGLRNFSALTLNDDVPREVGESLS